MTRSKTKRVKQTLQGLMMEIKSAQAGLEATQNGSLLGWCAGSLSNIQFAFFTSLLNLR